MSTPYLNASETPLLLQVKRDLERHEAFREFAYPDPLSKLAKKYPKLPWGYKPARDLLPQDTNWDTGKPWTVGFGFTDGTTPDSRINRQMAERKLEQKILDMHATLPRFIPWYKEANQLVQGILINMAFNMGINGLLEFKNTLRYIQQKNYKQAATNMRKSLWFQQTGSRARELSMRMETQTIPAEFKAPERI